MFQYFDGPVKEARNRVRLALELPIELICSICCPLPLLWAVGGPFLLGPIRLGGERFGGWYNAELLFGGVLLAVGRLVNDGQSKVLVLRWSARPWELKVDATSHQRLLHPPLGVCRVEMPFADASVHA